MTITRGRNQINQNIFIYVKIAVGRETLVIHCDSVYSGITHQLTGDSIKNQDSQGFDPVQYISVICSCPGKTEAGAAFFYFRKQIFGFFFFGCKKQIVLAGCEQQKQA